MIDPYLYTGTHVLKNTFGIRDKEQLDKLESDYTSLALRDLTKNPIPGNWDFNHLCKYNEAIFKAVYDWAGIARTITMFKEEKTLGGLSVDYTPADDIQREASLHLEAVKAINWKQLNSMERAEAFSDSLATLWKIHPFREGNTRTTVTFCCAFYESLGYNIDRELFEVNSSYVRNALVAYNAVFGDLGDLSKPEYLIRIVQDAIGDEPPLASMKGIMKRAEEKSNARSNSIPPRAPNHDHDVEI